MGSHQPLVAVLVSDKKLDHFCLSQMFSSVNQNNLVFHPGKVSPPGGDGSTLRYKIDTSKNIYRARHKISEFSSETSSKRVF